MEFVLTSASAGEISLTDAGITAATGYGMVFVGLILLMLVILVLGKIMGHRKAAPAPVAAPAPAAAPAAAGKPAPGSAGEVKLYDVSDRDAAMIMAIVAEKMGRPLNELRFKSIKEVK